MIWAGSKGAKIFPSLRRWWRVLERSYLFEASAEPLEHPLHVAALLHGNDAGVVLLIDPYQECLLIVVPMWGSCNEDISRTNSLNVEWVKLPHPLTPHAHGMRTITVSWWCKSHAPYQIPLASGQSRAIPAQVSSGDTGLSNRKWSYTRLTSRKGQRWTDNTNKT